MATLLTRDDVGNIVGGVGSIEKATGLAPGVAGVARGVDFYSRAQSAADGRPFDVIFESVGGNVLADSLLAVAPGGIVISYGAAAGQQDAPTPTPGQLRTRNLALIGFSIINLSRSAPAMAHGLISGVLALTREGLSIPAPRQIDWDRVIDAHLEQSAGSSKGKTVVRVK